MITSIESQPQERPNYEDQDSADAKGIASLITTFEGVAKQTTPEQQNTFLINLRTNREGIQKLFERRNIAWGGTLPEIIERLKQAAVDIEKRIVNAEVYKEPQFFKLEKSTEATEPTLPHEDEEAFEEREDIQEALALLELFGSDKDPNEKVEITVTQGGLVEVLFEEDIEEAESLHQDRVDIYDTEKRIGEYERIIEGERSQSENSFFKKLFSKQGDKGDEVELSETEIKYGRAVEGLNNKIKKLENDEARLHERIIEKKNALGKTLTLTGTEAFSGTWGELLNNLRNTLQDLQSASKNKTKLEK